MRPAVLWLLFAPLLSSARYFVQAEQTRGSGHASAFRCPAAAVAHMQSAGYPEVIRVYDEGHTARSAEEAERAALGQRWRHRREFAVDTAVAAFTELYGRQPTDYELRDERSRWVHTLMDYPEALRQAVRMNCERLFDRADTSRPAQRDELSW